MVKNVLFLLAASLFLSTSFAAERVRLTRYEGERLTGVSASFLFEVELISSSSTQAVVEIPAELEPYLTFSKNAAGVVQVGMDIPQQVQRRIEREHRNYWEKNRPVLKLYTAVIEQLALSSAASATATGPFAGKQVNVHISGAAKMERIDLRAESLHIRISGAGKADIRAQSPSADVRLEGAGKLDLSLHENQTLEWRGSGAGNSRVDCDAARADIRLEGAGKLDLLLTANEALNLRVSGAGQAKVNSGTHLADVTLEGSGKANLILSDNEELKVVAHGAGKLEVKGEGQNLTVQSSGSSTLSAREFTAQWVKVDASASSKVTVFANRYLEAKATGSARVRYSGNPTEKIFSHPNISEIR